MKILKRIKTILKQHPVLTTVLFFQILLILYLNLFQLDKFCGFDCSADRLAAMEMWKQKRLFLSNWSHINTLIWDAPTLLAALFFGMFQDISFAWGLAVSICATILHLLFATST